MSEPNLADILLEALERINRLLEDDAEHCHQNCIGDIQDVLEKALAQVPQSSRKAVQDRIPPPGTFYRTFF